MPIRKGESWGEPGSLAEGAPILNDNGSLRSFVTAAMAAGQTEIEVGLRGGDLGRTVGATAGSPRPGESQRLPCDLMRIRTASGDYHACAHVVARRSWWRGRIIAVMNAAWIGEWNVGPRAHPGDSLLDSFDANPTFQDRVRARQRLPVGDHVPHPNIATRRARALTFELERELDLYLDGERIERVKRFDIEVVPALLVAVV